MVKSLSPRLKAFIKAIEKRATPVEPQPIETTESESEE